MWWPSDELIAGLGGALIGSFATGLVTWWLHRADHTRTKKEELRNALMAILDLRQQRFATGKITQEDEKSLSYRLIHNKQLIYLEACERIVQDIPENVSASEYNTLADELCEISHFNPAERYYVAAIKSAQTNIHKVIALRSIANFYFRNNPRRNFEMGRKYFQQASDVLEGAADTYSNYEQGFTYERWGILELANGFKVEGEKYISRARKYYEDMPRHSPGRERALMLLDMRARDASGNIEPKPIGPPSPVQIDAEP